MSKMIQELADDFNTNALKQIAQHCDLSVEILIKQRPNLKEDSSEVVCDWLEGIDTFKQVSYHLNRLIKLQSSK